NDLRAARRAARVLHRGLDRLRPRVAEEGLRPAEALREGVRELLLRLRAEEIRRVPDAVELRVRRSGHGRVAMAELRHRDAAGEVEILAAVGIANQTAVALDEL